MSALWERQSIRRLVGSALFCLTLLLVLSYASAVLKPTRSLLKGDAGAAWYGYLNQPADSIDVVFFGSSHAFDGVDPSIMWKTQGIPSYVLAGPVQHPRIERHYIAEAYRTQKPQVVAMEISNLSYNQRNYVTEFQLVNVGYMPWGVNKLRAILDTPKADRPGALVDLWAYHTRWSELKPADFNILRRSPNDEYLKGYQVLAQSRPVTPTMDPVPKKEKPSILAAEKRNTEYLREIARFCEDNDAELLLFLTPTGPPSAYTPLLERAKKELSGEFDNVTFLDLSVPGAVPGLSYQDDFFDAGHLATSGAEKSTRVLADYIAKRYRLTDRRGEPGYEHWERDVKRRDERVEKVSGTKK